jgi:outer membrane protein OmpA-like peptidoglycan-associated protein
MMRILLTILTILTVPHILLAQEIVKKNLGDSINTTFFETKPLISPDGKTLYFARQNYPQNKGGEMDEQDIYYSELTISGWSKAKNIGEPLNNEHPNGVVSISPNGMQMILLHVYREGNKFKDGIAISTKSADGWSVPVRIEIEDFYNKSEYIDYFLSNNGKELLIAVDRKEGYGDQDLYLSSRLDEKHWSTPVNLGDKINTKKPEFSPFLAADNKTLFFASMGHDSYGNSDVFYTKRLDDTWTNWSDPINLGPEVNTDGFEAYYSIPTDGLEAYYVSSTGAKEGSRDIFTATLPYRFRPDPVLLLKGNLQYADNFSDTSDFTITFLTSSSNESDILIEYAANNYNAILPTGGSYFFYVEKSDHLSESYYVDLTDQKEYREEEIDIVIVPIKENQQITTHNLQFESGNAELLPESYFELVRLLDIFRRNERVQVEFTVHAHDLDSEAENMKLANLRSDFISNFLKDNDLPKEQFVFLNMGSQDPYDGKKVKNLKEEINPNNRIDIKILSTDWDLNAIEQQISDIAEVVSLKNTAVDSALSVEVIAQNFMVYFDFDSDVVNLTESQAGSILDYFNSGNQDSIRITGYTCNMGPSAYNLELSKRRAEAIRKWLVEHEINGDKISVNYKGAAEPKAINSTQEGRIKNRRVELIGFTSVLAME